MPAKQGEFCTRCGMRSTKLREGNSFVYYCPNKHGEQGREAIPEEPAAEATPAEPSVDEIEQRRRPTIEEENDALFKELDRVRNERDEADDLIAKQRDEIKRLEGENAILQTDTKKLADATSRIAELESQLAQGSIIDLLNQAIYGNDKTQPETPLEVRIGEYTARITKTNPEPSGVTGPLTIGEYADYTPAPSSADLDAHAAEQAAAEQTQQ